ncbi:hypothetical protein MOX02_51450 [Methylobacterium oxalidis]|uniref:Uncharacterized protein n=1 Tax=Methylobacterium oxalidis TaxID=944322 RepID=A0A512JAW1_9HYPH|nr:hypothetical protein MOX02_51450 [Methylobacterium oxalidis]GLS66174.1 hypothetical protein GCM10007888_45560 [Methylobacterium oxalidis]
MKAASRDDKVGSGTDLKLQPVAATANSAPRQAARAEGEKGMALRVRAPIWRSWWMGP